MYELPSNLDTCNGMLYCLLEWANTTTDGIFIPAVLLGAVVIMIIGTQRFGSARSFGFSLVVGALASMWMATAQLMQWWVASMFILAGAVGFAVLLLNER